MKIIDISVPINGKIPHWPGGTRAKLRRISKIKKEYGCNESSLDMNLHTGTHIDAPLHFISDGKTSNQILLNTFIGDVFVAHLPRVSKISSFELKTIKIPKGVKKVLFKTSNSLLWNKNIAQFNKKYVGITADGALWLAKQNFKLIGVDYLSVAGFDETVAVHKILLGKEMVLLEGINLSFVKSGLYGLICLPISILGTEASPVRAVLIKK